MWNRQECLEAGGAVGVGCESQPSSGGLRLTLTKRDSTAEGTADVGALALPVSGSVGSDGSLNIAGHGRMETTVITITNWQPKEIGDTVTGDFTVTFHPDDTAAGAVIVRAAMQNMVKEPK